MVIYRIVDLNLLEFFCFGVNLGYYWNWSTSFIVKYSNVVIQRSVKFPLGFSLCLETCPCSGMHVGRDDKNQMMYVRAHVKYFEGLKHTFLNLLYGHTYRYVSWRQSHREKPLLSYFIFLNPRPWHVEGAPLYFTYVRYIGKICCIF